MRGRDELARRCWSRSSLCLAFSELGEQACSSWEIVSAEERLLGERFGIVVLVLVRSFAWHGRPTVRALIPVISFVGVSV